MLYSILKMQKAFERQMSKLLENGYANLFGQREQNAYRFGFQEGYKAALSEIYHDDLRKEVALEAAYLAEQVALGSNKAEAKGALGAADLIRKVMIRDQLVAETRTEVSTPSLGEMSQAVINHITQEHREKYPEENEQPLNPLWAWIELHKIAGKTSDNPFQPHTFDEDVERVAEAIWRSGGYKTSASGNWSEVASADIFRNYAKAALSVMKTDKT